MLLHRRRGGDIFLPNSPKSFPDDSFFAHKKNGKVLAARAMHFCAFTIFLGKQLTLHEAIDTGALGVVKGCIISSGFCELLLCHQSVLVPYSLCRRRVPRLKGETIAPRGMA